MNDNIVPQNKLSRATLGLNEADWRQVQPREISVSQSSVNAKRPAEQQVKVETALPTTSWMRMSESTRVCCIRSIEERRSNGATVSSRWSFSIHFFLLNEEKLRSISSSDQAECGTLDHSKRCRVNFMLQIIQKKKQNQTIDLRAYAQRRIWIQRWRKTEKRRRKTLCHSGLKRNSVLSWLFQLWK